MSTEKSWAEKLIDTGYDFENGMKLVEKAMQHYMNKISYAIFPINKKDMVFILASLKITTKLLAEEDPYADKISEVLMPGITPSIVKTVIPNDMPQDEIDRLKDQIYHISD